MSSAFQTYDYQTDHLAEMTSDVTNPDVKWNNKSFFEKSIGSFVYLLEKNHFILKVRLVSML